MEARVRVSLAREKILGKYWLPVKVHFWEDAKLGKHGTAPKTASTSDEMMGKWVEVGVSPLCSFVPPPR